MKKNLIMVIHLDCTSKTETILIDTEENIISYLSNGTPVLLHCIRPLGTFLADADGSNEGNSIVPFVKLQQLKFSLMNGETLKKFEGILEPMLLSDNLLVHYVALKLQERCLTVPITEEEKLQFATWFDDTVNSFLLYHRTDTIKNPDGSHLRYAKAACARMPEDYMLLTSSDGKEFLCSSSPLALLAPYESILKENGFYVRKCCICHNFFITEKAESHVTCTKEECKKSLTNEVRKDRYQKNTERIPGEAERLADYQAWYAKKTRFEKKLYSKMHSSQTSPELKILYKKQLQEINSLYQEHLEISLAKRNDIVSGILSVEEYKDWLSNEKNYFFSLVREYETK